MNISACNLSIVPLRAEPNHRSEMVTQVLFGELFEVLEEGTDFCLIRMVDTGYEGWIQKNQFGDALGTPILPKIVDIFGARAYTKDRSVTLVHGTAIPNTEVQIGRSTYQIEGAIRDASLHDFETEFPKLISYYNNAPYLWGGRSVTGIDCSGFSQVVYKHFGIQLKRDAWQQAESGNAVDFLTEIKPGDLAFFDNEAGRITHVGIMIDAETIIHASAHIRIDKMDSQGILNAELNKYTHHLRIVKRYF